MSEVMVTPCDSKSIARATCRDKTLVTVEEEALNTFI
jgi:hypothetical protein